MARTTLKVTGESGMGLASVGSIIAKTLKRMGFYLHSDREYPSLIKGGHSSVQIDFDTQEVNCLTREVDIVVALDRIGLEEYLETLKPGGILIHGYERHQLIKHLEQKAKKRKLHLAYLPAREIATQLGGNALMTNVVLLGLLWKIMGLAFEPLRKQVYEEYADKPDLVKIDLACLKAGYQKAGELQNLPSFTIPHPKKKPKKLLLNGNHALALGAIHGGLRAYYAYPMSPSSSILTYMANWAEHTKMIVRQVEDEISVVQMTIGSMFMGTRAMCATSGGGFDLMTESVSLAAMTETPLVVIIAQRPGPATGLPTWTAQGDLNLAVYAAHGEFTRMVIGISDAASGFELIQHALNYAEQFQTPVIVLTEKVVAESMNMTDIYQQKKIPIKRGLVTNPSDHKKLKRSDRYGITKSGVSKRWIPGSSDTFYFGQGDEHTVDGTLTEQAEPVRKMMDKRLRKMDSMAKAMPEPQILGQKSKAKISFIGWGSSKNVMQDIVPHFKSQGISINYLHFDYLWPLKTKTLLKFAKDNQNLHILEGNATGQLANLIEQQTDLKLPNRFLKYNGRPFFFEDVEEYITSNLSL